jgi:hypothetical protein
VRFHAHSFATSHSFLYLGTAHAYKHMAKIHAYIHRCERSSSGRCRAS